MIYRATPPNDFYLAHHGVLGQKWGVRRYQNPDGTLTEAGKLRFKTNSDGSITKYSRKERKKNIELKRADVRAKLAKKMQDENGEWRTDKESAELARDRFVLDKDFPKFATKVQKHVATTMVAPIVGLGTLAVTKDGKRALTMALATAGGLTLGTAIESKKWQKETEKKYGLRGNKVESIVSEQKPKKPTGTISEGIDHKKPLGTNAAISDANPNLNRKKNNTKMTREYVKHIKGE